MKRLNIKHRRLQSCFNPMSLVLPFFYLYMVNGIKEVWKPPPSEISIPTTVKSDHKMSNEIIKNIEEQVVTKTAQISTRYPMKVTTTPPTSTTIPYNGGPAFDEKFLKKNISINAMLGKTAYLTCKVKNLGNKTVSWIRHRDVHLLTVGRYTYTNDDRFRAINRLNSNEWTLQIKYPQQRDAGIYECQISTTPHMSRFYHLNIIEPKAKILGSSELFIDQGSTINLTCIIIGGLDPQGFVFWYHNNRIINENSPRGGIKIVTETGSKSKSVLLLHNARPTDSGRYECNPTNANFKSIVIHVLSGSHPEAMQHSNSVPKSITTTSYYSFAAIIVMQQMYLRLLHHLSS